ncbi:hypothetical protein HYV21_00610 [Candidatus Microgenomates bacterium]|nr:hypothetical protein [Candidatus Microgenomates bacterium]
MEEIEKEKTPILIEGKCRNCGAPRFAAGSDLDSLTSTLQRLDAYVCEVGDHYFQPGTTLYDAYEWDFSTNKVLQSPL